MEITTLLDIHSREELCSSSTIATMARCSPVGAISGGWGESVKGIVYFCRVNNTL